MVAVATPVFCVHFSQCSGEVRLESQLDSGISGLLGNKHDEIQVSSGGCQSPGGVSGDIASCSTEYPDGVARQWYDEARIKLVEQDSWFPDENDDSNHPTISGK